jgi:hypothetical protein
VPRQSQRKFSLQIRWLAGGDGWLEVRFFETADVERLETRARGMQGKDLKKR